MSFTEKQLDILHEGFQKHDFTKEVALPGEESTVPVDEAKTFLAFKNRTRKYMKSNLPEQGIKRDMDSFSKNHPINLLMEADAAYVADKATKIAGNPLKTMLSVGAFFLLFGPKFRILYKASENSYCKPRGLEKKDLTKEEHRLILQHTVDRIVEVLSGAVMQGQKFPEIYEATKKNPTHEDYPNRRTTDKINFHKKWTHSDTEVGSMLPLDEQADKIAAKSSEEDLETRLLWHDFCETLNEGDREIVRRRERGQTLEEIAEALCFANHSAVSKRLKAIHKRFEEYKNDT